MKEAEVLEMIKEAGYKVAYHHFEEEEQEKTPFVVYLYPNSNNFAADGTVYKTINVLNVELYTVKKDIAAERRMEEVLKKHEIFYEKTESYIESEKMYEILYEMEVLIDG